MPSSISASVLLVSSALLALAAPARAQSDNQTADTSPIVVNGSLPFDISMAVQDPGSVSLPGLQSYAIGEVGDDWVLVAGRTNGLHGFVGNGTQNFPPEYQNTEVWVIDPVTNQSWSRSLTDPSANLTASEVTALSATSTEFYQNNSTLYVAGGYVYDATADNFTTYNTLTALDLGGVINWVQTGTGSLAQDVRQTTNPAFQVTGGDMKEINGLTLLSLGQDFEGPYSVASNGNYTQQIRTFNVMDNGVTLSVANLSSTTPNPDFRRRDLNIVPILQSDGHGGYIQSQSALSGVFTTAGGAWTVPIEISANGTATEADPAANTTFKQGMNNYQSPVISLYDSATDSTHSVLLGGISYQYYDSANGTFASDPFLPFINQSTDVVRTDTGNYTQYLLSDASFPAPPGTSSSLLFGAGAHFILSPDVPTIDGMVDIRSITGTILLGYVFGGIVADQGDFGNTTASNTIFDVYYTSVPEPAATPLALTLAALAITAFRRKSSRP